MLLLALACSENKIHSTEEVPEVHDSMPAGDSPADSPVDSEPPDPCEDAPEDETACDGLDEDCDGSIDEGSGLTDCITWWPNADGDSLGTGEPDCTCELPANAALAPGDCDDSDPSRLVCESCLDILDKGFSTGDGAYSIDPDGAGDFEVLCDMSTEGGGWTLALSMNAVGMDQYDGAEVFESKTSFGSHADDNYLSEAFYRLSFTNSYVVDEAHAVPVLSETEWSSGTIGQEIDGMLTGTPSASNLWYRTPRTAFQLRNSETTDHVFEDGDMRAHFLLNGSSTSDIAWPVSLEYQADERHLVFDSDFGYAGARIYTDEPYDVATYGVDERIRLFLR